MVYRADERMAIRRMMPGGGFQDRIFAQDQPIVTSQLPERLPLDLAEELHLPSDRMAIAYRKYIRGLGLTFGTA